MEYYTYSSNQYNKLEEVLKYINKHFVTVDDDSIREANPILIRVLDTIISGMRSVSPLFNCMYETPMYGGSFYDGLKVGEPNEFDIDLKLSLPKILNALVIPSSEPGFVYVHLKDWARFKKDKYLYSSYKDLEYLKDSYNYLAQEKVLRWIQQIVAKALNKIKQEKLLPDVKVTFSMGGPAATLHIVYNNRKMDVDLVAVFRMPGNKCPQDSFRQISQYSDFLLVPKAPKTNVSNRSWCWRLSFQEQEQHIINRRNFCKPALRLLKKLRDTRDHNIPSYFIKTVFLWKIEEEDGLFYWNKSLNFVFMEMLEKYKEYLDNGKIPYYWNENNNLLQYTGGDTIYNVKNFLQRMINTIHRNIDSDPYIIAKFLLPQGEYIQLVRHFNGTVYECARNDNRLYSEFKAKDNRDDSGKGSTFLRFLAGAAVIAAAIFFTRSAP